MPYHLELGSGGNDVAHHTYKGKAIVVNSQTGKHYSTEPIPIKKAKAQKRLLEQVEQTKKPSER